MQLVAFANCNYHRLQLDAIGLILCRVMYSSVEKDEIRMG